MIMFFSILIFICYMAVGLYMCGTNLREWQVCKGFHNRNVAIFLGIVGWPRVLQIVRRWRKAGCPRKMIMRGGPDW